MNEKTKMKNDLKDRINKISYQSQLVNEKSFHYVSGNAIVLWVKFFITKIFCLGSDSRLLAKGGFNVLIVSSDLLNSNVLNWINKAAPHSVDKIWSVLWDAYIMVLGAVSSKLTYYWVWWLLYYLEKDTNFNETLKKMSRNILVPMDMPEFYRVLVYANDERFEMVKSNIQSFKFEEFYRARQIRNGMVPQF